MRVELYDGLGRSSATAGNHRKGFFGGGPHIRKRGSEAVPAMSSRFSASLRIIQALTHPGPQNPTARPWYKATGASC